MVIENISNTSVYIFNRKCIDYLITRYFKCLFLFLFVFCVDLVLKSLFVNIFFFSSLLKNNIMCKVVFFLTKFFIYYNFSYRTVVEDIR